MKRVVLGMLCCLLVVFSGLSAHAALTGAAYYAVVTDWESNSSQEILATGNVSEGAASASVFDELMSAAVAASEYGGDSYAEMRWNAPASSTVRVSFSWEINNPGDDTWTAWTVENRDSGYYMEWSLTGSGIFSDTFLVGAGEVLLIVVGASSEGMEVDGVFYPAVARNVSLSNLDATAVPLPPAVLLLGSGIVGLTAFRKRFSRKESSEVL